MDNQENVTRDNEGADKKLLEDEVGRLFFKKKNLKPMDKIHFVENEIELLLEQIKPTHLALASHLRCCVVFEGSG